MTKILLISSIFISLGAAVLGFLNRDRLLEARSEVDVVQSQLTLTDQQLEAAIGELEAQKKKSVNLGVRKKKSRRNWVKPAGSGTKPRKNSPPPNSKPKTWNQTAKPRTPESGNWRRR